MTKWMLHVSSIHIAVQHPGWLRVDGCLYESSSHRGVVFRPITERCPREHSPLRTLIAPRTLEAGIHRQLRVFRLLMGPVTLWQRNRLRSCRTAPFDPGHQTERAFLVGKHLDHILLTENCQDKPRTSSPVSHMTRSPNVEMHVKGIDVGLRRHGYCMTKVIFGQHSFHLSLCGVF